MKILIVEDEAVIREGIVKLLSKLSGFELVGEAENGQDGLNILKELKPDIVITDIRMADMDGLEMLTQMVELGIKTKAIVLSAYSEFEYARKAMKLGVTEYLLKPISYTDFVQALENVKVQVEALKKKKPDKIGTIEQIFYSLISEGMDVDHETETYLKNNFQIEKTQNFMMVCVYLGNNYSETKNTITKYFEHVFSVYKNISYLVLKSVHRNSLMILLYHYESAHDLERYIQYQIMNASVGQISIGLIETVGIETLKKAFDTLFPYMDWNISLNEKVLISYPKITNIQTVSCIYPIELETKMKVAICAFDWDKTKELITEFYEYFHDGKVYVPKEIKECYVRFLWMIIGIAKEIGCLDKKELEQQKLLGTIMNAKVQEELIGATEQLIEHIMPLKTENDATHLTVKRVQSIVHEFYQTGITLDKIGIKLNVTPEYLGTLFHKEMGVTFSTYMKNYRIGKAKKLLCGTQLKLYEVSERVGYSDPKYFSKVFREVTGQLPTDYRKTYR